MRDVSEARKPSSWVPPSIVFARERSIPRTSNGMPATHDPTSGPSAGHASASAPRVPSSTRAAETVRFSQRA